MHAEPGMLLSQYHHHHAAQTLSSSSSSSSACSSSSCSSGSTRAASASSAPPPWFQQEKKHKHASIAHAQKTNSEASDQAAEASAAEACVVQCTPACAKTEPAALPSGSSWNSSAAAAAAATFDLRLASTYVPAVACLMRGSLLILFISRFVFTRSLCSHFFPPPECVARAGSGSPRACHC